MKKLHTAIIFIALAIALLGCDEKKATVAETDKNTTKLTKPVLSTYRVRKEIPITFTKVAGHSYALKTATSGVTLGDVVGDTTKKQVSSTVVVSGIVVVATLDGNSIDSDPIDFLFHVANKAALQAEITEAIKLHGNEVNLNYIDTSEVTDMSKLFEDKKDFNGDISKWDVSEATNMIRMFQNARKFNQPLTTWNVSKVTDMYGMFQNARAFNQPLTTWNVSKVTDMGAMFNLARAFNQPLNSWNISSVTNMREMFRAATVFNQDLRAWAEKSGRYTTDMFAGAMAMQTLNKPTWAR